MLCPKCGNRRWRVTDSRHPDGESSVTSAAYQRASSMVSWYTSEYTARKRVCGNCGHAAYTVELLLDDLYQMSTAVKENDPDALRALLIKPRSPKKL